VATPARCILPDATYFVSVRCVSRTMRLVPTPRVLRVVRYCLAFVLQRYRQQYGLRLFEFLFMSNHFHLLLYNERPCIPDFMRDLNALLSRALNAMRGLRGTNFEKNYSLVRVLDPEHALEHAVYTLANPVAAHLVTRTRKWPGASSVGMRYGEPVEVVRPDVGLWKTGADASRLRSKLPETATLVLDRPPCRPELDDDALRAEVLKRLRTREDLFAAERRRRGRRVLGARAVRRMRFFEMPPPEELFRRKPTFSGVAGVMRRAAAAAARAFQRAYREASARFRAGHRDVVFPAGTWLYRVRFGAACHPCGPP